MTTDRAKALIEEAASAHGRNASDLWERLVKELNHPSVAGNYATYKTVTQICEQAIEAAGADADAHEMAQTLRDELKRRADDHELVRTMNRHDPSEMVEAAYIWALGETGDVTMDTELTFGKYEGKTLSWLFENDRDYANWIIKEMKEDRPHLATFLALEEDRRREDEGGMYTYWREEDHLLGQ